MVDKADLRRRMSAMRNRLTPREQAKVALAMANSVSRHPVYLNARTIAAYFAMAGELDPMPLMKLAARQGKTVYLPVLRSDRMVFVRFRPGFNQLRKNRYNIPEPLWRKTLEYPPQHLDLVFVPLLAFDCSGTRLGMGGGYYDRTFSFKRNKLKRRGSPLLIGLGHSFQQLGKIPANHWDVPIEGVATEAGVRLMPDRRRSFKPQHRPERGRP